MRAAAAATMFVIAFFAFAFLFLATPVIPDADSYFHLAVAREYAAHGPIEALPWTRFSVLGETYGDKELLFHYLLVPFATWTDPATGGRLALALLNAAFAATMTFFAARALGWWSLVVPLWLYAAAPMLTFRLIRLRPELLALLLLLALTHAAAARRVRLVALTAAAFALSYTAFHVVVGLAGLWFLLTIRERDWKLPAAAGIGAAAGLIAHPGFPSNLRIWWIQNVLFFFEKSKLDVGSEIEAAPLRFLILLNLGWWAGVALLWLVSRGGAAEKRRFRFIAVAALVFGVLTLLLQRMAVYFVPLFTLLPLAKLEVRQHPHRGRIALALLATAVLSLPTTRGIFRDLLLDSGWEADYAAFAKAVPPEAKVAAHWGPAELYCFWEPQGRYLNVLDPIFMAVDFPAEYAAQRRVFDGTDPDTPHTVSTILNSDFIAFPSTSPLFARLQFDPRIVPVHNGLTFLGRIETAGTQRFVRDWRTEEGAPVPLTSPVRAYIDASRFSRARCVTLIHDDVLTAPTTRAYELASYGRAELRIDGNPPGRAAASGARLGKGSLFRTALAAGSHRFTVTTCPAEGGENGFYLVDRSAAAPAQ